MRLKMTSVLHQQEASVLIIPYRL